MKTMESPLLHSINCPKKTGKVWHWVSKRGNGYSPIHRGLLFIFLTTSIFVVQNAMSKPNWVKHNTKWVNMFLMLIINQDYASTLLHYVFCDFLFLPVGHLLCLAIAWVTTKAMMYGKYWNSNGKFECIVFPENMYTSNSCFCNNEYLLVFLAACDEDGYIFVWLFTWFW